METTTPCIIWDLDGVLVLTAEQHYASWRRALGEIGVEMTPEQFRETFGQRNEEILYRLLGDGAAAALADGVPERKERYYREIIAGGIPLAPGAERWLRYAAERGIPQAVASSTPRENVDAVLQGTGTGGYFGAIRAGEDVSRGKPAPDVFLAAAAALGCSPDVCLVVEDAPAGVEAARAAGMRCLAVVTSHPPDRLADASLVVPSLADADPEETLRRLFGAA